jgi:two-component system sensor histidine kinase EvgS
MFGAESGVVAAVLETFLASIADSVRDLQAARDVGDMVAIAAMAHRIKGAANMSGALALARIAVCLEGLARDGDWALMRALMAQLETQWLLLQRDPDLRRMASIAP